MTEVHRFLGQHTQGMVQLKRRTPIAIQLQGPAFESPIVSREGRCVSDSRGWCPLIDAHLIQARELNCIARQAGKRNGMREVWTGTRCRYRYGSQVR